MDKLAKQLLKNDESLKKIHDKIDKIEDWNLLSETPMVTVCVPTYNHENYLRETLDGILMQKVDFDYEILIKEDKSTDSTRVILQEYQQKHPDKIRLWLCKENLYSQKLKPRLFLFARGKYIANCEGDDYWTDPHKLQKQIDILERHDNIVASFTNAVFLNMLENSKIPYVENLKEGIVSDKDIFERGGRLYPTASFVYKKDSYCKQNHVSVPEMAGDEILLYRLALIGKIHFLDEETCVYRRWSGGVYSCLVNDIKKLIAHRKKDIVAYRKFNILTNGKVKVYLKKRLRANSLYIVKNSASIIDKVLYCRYLSLKDIARIILKK